MCGIAGAVTFDGRPLDAYAVQSMRDALSHRGPDAAGLHLSPSAVSGLGFRRLKILDLSDSANQPLPNEDGSVHVVFNGEIYNFTSLRAELVQRGHRFRSRTDSEVIVHLYEELGASCVERLDGMFAIAIWDEPRRTLVLARDRTGKKPLFYARSEGSLGFASEIKSFFGQPEFDLSIDPEAIPRFLLHGYVPCPQTLYRGVRQLEPGTVMTVDAQGRTSSRRFWRLRYPTSDQAAGATIDRADAVRQVRHLVTSAVERRLVSDVPLGAFLSGGVDSTIVVGLMSRLLDRPVKTFSIGFKNAPAYDETAFARVAAQRFKTDHTEFIVDPGAFDMIERLIWHHDGPFGDSSAVPTSIVAELTRKQVTVVLTGDGSDEVFAGYLRFYAALAAERTPRVVRKIVRGVAGAVPGGPHARHWLSRLQRFASAASLPLDERLTRWSALFYDDLEALLSPELAGQLGTIDRLQYLRRFEDEMVDLSPLARALLVNFNTYLLDDLLVKLDRCTMAHSLEARSPFLDTALIDYVAQLPDSTKLARGRTKIILREAFADLIPPEIQRRGKMGFGIPFGLWFRGSLRDVVDDFLLSKDARYREYLSTVYVHELVRRHQAGEADLGLQLWTLLTFEMWLRALPSWTSRPRANAAAAV